MTAGKSDSPAMGEEGLAAEPCILLFMEPGRNRELLAETLDSGYEVETTTDVDTLNTDFDCCVFDRAEFSRVAGTVQSRRDGSNPHFLPFVLLLEKDTAGRRNPELWEYVDDVISLPVEKAELLSRVENLIQRRQTSLKLAEREEQLEKTIEDLKTKELAMDAAPIGITIAKAGNGDNPLIYANQGFEDLTGYTEDIIGRDCRFLQGDDTDPLTTATIREAIDGREPVSVDIVNYRKTGQKFWNKLDIAPIQGDGGTTHFVGFQTDITERKIRERRLEVMNRVLNHNLRNKMNIIEGHVELLHREMHDDALQESLSVIKHTATDLLRLGESVREIQRTLSIGPSSSGIHLGQQIRQLVGALEDRYPAAEIELSLPAEGFEPVAIPGLVAAVEEAIENAIKHNDNSTPTVAIRVSEGSGVWIDIEIEDDGPGIPIRELSVLSEGETDLKHADRLGIWMIYWTVSRVGGNLSVSDADPRGTVLTLSIPINS